MNDAADKIKMMKGSIRCLIFGILGLLPLIGLPFAMATLWISGQVHAKENYFWNPARPYRISGVVCAVFGTIFWGFILMLIIYSTVSNPNGHGYYNGGGAE